MRSISSRMICLHAALDPPAERQVRPQAGADLLDEARAHEQLVALGDRVARRVPQRREEVARGAHRQRFFGGGKWSGRPSATSAASLVASPSVGCAAIESPTVSSVASASMPTTPGVDQLGGVHADDDHAEQLAVARLADDLHEARAVAVHGRARDRRVRQLPMTTLRRRAARAPAPP